jgi:hypothetical protein
MMNMEKEQHEVILANLASIPTDGEGSSSSSLLELET